MVRTYPVVCTNFFTTSQAVVQWFQRTVQSHLCVVLDRTNDYEVLISINYVHNDIPVSPLGNVRSLSWRFGAWFLLSGTHQRVET